MASSGQFILNSVHPKLQPTHTRNLRMRAHTYKNLSKDLQYEISPSEVLFTLISI